MAILSRSAKKKAALEICVTEQDLATEAAVLEVLFGQTPEARCFAGRGRKARPPPQPRAALELCVDPLDGHHQYTPTHYPSSPPRVGLSPGGVALLGPSSPALRQLTTGGPRSGCSAATTAPSGERHAAIWPAIAAWSRGFATNRPEEPAGPPQLRPSYCWFTPPHPWRPDGGGSARWILGLRGRPAGYDELLETQGLELGHRTAGVVLR